MNYDKIMTTLGKSGEVTPEVLDEMFVAISQVFPMILVANLTRNSYVMLSDDGFLYHRLAATGNYDEMIADGVKSVHPTYQSVFLEAFERKNIMRTYERGITNLSVKLYQKDPQGEYQWVTTRVIRLKDESGDVVHICLNYVM